MTRSDRADNDPLAERKPQFGVCAGPECDCPNAPERGRDQCRLCRRGYHSYRRRPL